MKKKKSLKLCSMQELIMLFGPKTNYENSKTTFLV